MTAYIPTKAAAADFNQWLRFNILRDDILCVHGRADAIADSILLGHDWSASATVEVPSRYTRDRTPVIYTFGDADLEPAHAHTPSD